MGKRRESVPLPGGPLIVCLEVADGPWRARLTHLEPDNRPRVSNLPPQSGGQVKVADTAKARGWRRLGGN
ncbi:hypothetical protein ACIRP0_22710 [Streptomyces sp. NPDC101733]|uniref:hypothetical protein n=1 Tax=unclassified Streptomyces TaxID=2593676 RepID=UPI00381CA0A1